MYDLQTNKNTKEYKDLLPNRDAVKPCVKERLDKIHESFKKGIEATGDDTLQRFTHQELYAFVKSVLTSGWYVDSPVYKPMHTRRENLKLEFIAAQEQAEEASSGFEGGSEESELQASRSLSVGSKRLCRSGMNLPSSYKRSPPSSFQGPSKFPRVAV